ncbi:hypothetical protein BDP81DRAFT_321474 [Colletotrichum phormii]|uniref:Heterokaryon incompatibility domain-containing protein n=1 Tax=Colletotrichum phormii TaxID=359342 RepID=A0AAJ0EGF5_9PEZI|nr:uncharacterized protein BDP81DRAFT_321474 [Colletotrichum phormii]KAK1635905.1 hypothetical protein BDP81DRAFT_321474 [Colletotrichum phormii]
MQKIAAHLPESTSSETTIRTIKGWLDECSSSHTCSHKNGKHAHQQQASPKRLLQISNDTVVLQENTGQQRYACLSYCWGDSAQITKTTGENIEDHQRNIPLNQLNATFRDAITVCRSLGVSYL